MAQDEPPKTAGIDDQRAPAGDGPGEDAALICFARGTLIRCPAGERPIEALRAGDPVLTRDHGVQPIRWIASRRLGPAELAAFPRLRPVLIRRDALGAGIPDRDLRVSPQHRILLRSHVAQKLFGTPEVLAAAKQLLQIPGLDIDTNAAEVEYFHMLFERHEIVWSNGAETESLYTGKQALLGIGPAALEEIFTLFPELRDQTEPPAGARKLLSGRMARKLAVRHVQHRKALVS